MESDNSNNYLKLDYNLYNKVDGLINPNYAYVSCINCGERGHVLKYCIKPITSFGIIAYKIIYNLSQEMGDVNDDLKHVLKKQKIKYEYHYPKIKFLMIQRKDTMGYIDFVRGKYPEGGSEIEDKEKMDKVKILMNEMTYEEKKNLLTRSFDDIWSDLWVRKDSRLYKNEYENAKKKFYSFDINKLVNESETTYDFQEFSFPKGRKEMKENNIDCAKREFIEETGYNDRNLFKNISEKYKIEEEFTGTNGVKYRHIYYLVRIPSNIIPPSVDYNNKTQIGEVKNVGWFSLEECLSLIRPYDTAKSDMIKTVHKNIMEDLSNYKKSPFFKRPQKDYYQEPFKFWRFR